MCRRVAIEIAEAMIPLLPQMKRRRRINVRRLLSVMVKSMQIQVLGLLQVLVGDREGLGEVFLRQPVHRAVGPQFCHGGIERLN